VRRFVLLLALGCVLAGCGGGGDSGGAKDNPSPKEQAKQGNPVLGQSGDEQPAGPALGFPVFATKNTTRVGGADPVADAAAVAQAVYPSRSTDTRPHAVVLVDQDDWRASIAASVLGSAPVRAPVLFSESDSVPEATADALDKLKPTGSRAAGGAQVIRIGDVKVPDGLKTTDVDAGEPAVTARAIDKLQSAAAGKPSDTVVVASADRPDFAMPAAGWAAKSGDPVLWAGRDSLPPQTRTAIGSHKRPRIFVLGPADAISDGVLAQLKKLGKAERVGDAGPVTNAIAFARFASGWNVTDPGHGFVFASTSRTGDAAAGAMLSASGAFGPLLLLTQAQALPQELQDYLLDVQPGYDKDPVRGVYNHGWLMGDEAAISADVQSRLDTLLEIQKVDSGGD
jgi:hypothetical protein